MEEMVIWEQYTVTLSKDPRKGFGFAVSGGRDRPSGVNGDTSVFVSDVVPGGPADGRLQARDNIVMVNGLSMENVSSSFAIQTLKTCGKLVNITLKRPKKIHLPVTKTSQLSSQPLPGNSVHSANTARYDSDGEDQEDEPSPRSPGKEYRYDSYSGSRPQDDMDYSRGYDGDSSSERSSGHYRDDSNYRKQLSKGRRKSQDGGYRRHSQDSGSDWQRPQSTNGYGKEEDANGLALVSGFKRLPRQDVLMKPIKSVLVKRKENEEYGLKLGSQIFIKHIAESGLASKDSSLQEGDLILKINGITSENMSLADTRRLIERSEGTLTLLVLRDNRQFLVSIPEVRDSDSDSSQMDDISDIGSELSHLPPAESAQCFPGPPRMNSLPEGRPGSREPAAARPANEMPISDSPEAAEESGCNTTYGSPTPRASEKEGYSPDAKIVRFVKAKSIGLRLAGGNDVGIFVAGVQEGSPAAGQGIKEGDQILQVNDTSFQSLPREDAVQYLLSLPPGEEVVLQTQCKQDIYRKMIKSNVGDSFYIRTHFDFEKDAPSGLSFTRGEVFHVVDTMYRGKLGSWLVVRMGRDLQELDKGIIPNRSRAEQIASLESVLKATAAPSSSGPRAEFWKLRGLRGAKKNLRKSREDLSVLTKQGHYPPYERVVLKEASFKRPVVILGPIADIAMEKLAAEMPNQFEIALSVARDTGSSKVIKLDSVRQIAERDKHALLDITPSAVERLNYVQYYPVVVFCDPDSRQGIKALRQWLVPDSKKSSRRLYAQAMKMKKYCSHLFTATISLSGSSNTWYQTLKDLIRTHQARPIWTTEEQVDASPAENLDLLNQQGATGLGSGYLTCDSRANSDYEDTDGEAGAYTDNELEDVYDHPALARSSEPALARSSEPALARSSEPVLARSSEPVLAWSSEPALARSSEPAEPDPTHNLSERVAAALAYPTTQPLTPSLPLSQEGDQQAQGQWRQEYSSMREYEHDALKKKFTRARDYDSDQDEDYDWGPATDV
ncbi:PREDICTED: tight junction protein ZO-3 isoform X2 [Gavialis gangeticus]|nr:PREDICTED: tight junction protein ZO-3 isoform X2 [Gavialis gangeticus]XP_019368805.1 PREDICTED: tight junction protein ZO-3 isoform X2 [Gavialis gangeticus]XP_019368806.1 PREDICTED: tight junction protein ZO-3 isoform X2 [Gavialis gangeticus]XP_019368807.1 PREDICTED: tight junction protein ZO-3 isoform X2 [Gavialis gangeticus]XP_019368808.1 PREDICTED: tight junction protein ZO-3 isoform X2 [Gavialis gangeticus]